MNEPEVLLLDEPTSGADPVTRRHILELLQMFMENESHSILFSTHLTEDLDRIADRIVLIDNGRILLNEEKEAMKQRFARNEDHLPAIEEIMVYVKEQKREVWR